VYDRFPPSLIMKLLKTNICPIVKKIKILVLCQKNCMYP